MLLDADKGILKFCVVPFVEEKYEAILRKIPIDNDEGYVPHFNLDRRGQNLKIARIPIDWYGKEKSSIFEEV